MIREFGLSIKFRWSGGGEKMKKGSSEASDEQKTRKIGFPRARMSRKRRKLAFGHGRRVKNNENSVSAMAESLKMEKTTFRPRPKVKKRLKQAFQPPG